MATEGQSARFFELDHSRGFRTPPWCDRRPRPHTCDRRPLNSKNGSLLLTKLTMFNRKKKCRTLSPQGSLQSYGGNTMRRAALPHTGLLSTKLRHGCRETSLPPSSRKHQNRLLKPTAQCVGTSPQLSACSGCQGSCRSPRSSAICCAESRRPRPMITWQLSHGTL